MVSDEKVVKSNIILSLFLFWGLKNSFRDKMSKRALVENVKLNYLRTSLLPKLLILLMTLLNRDSPTVKLRALTPRFILDFLDKLFYMHVSYVLEHGMIPVKLENKIYKEKEISNQFLYDYIIIGSGPGAGIAAMSLPKDKNILVLEKGRSYSVDVSLKHTLANMILDFSQSGMQLVWGKKLINISQGETLGGGSEINSGLYKTLRGEKRDRLNNILGVKEEDFSKAENYVEKLLKPVNDPLVNKEDSLLYRGGVKMELVMGEVPRWRSKVGGRWVNNSIKATIWEKEDFDIITNFTVSKIITKDTHILVNGLDATTNSKVSYLGKKVILAAGTTSSPVILKNSNLITAKDVKFNFAPMLRVFARVQPSTLGGEDIDPFQGYSKEDGFKYGSGVSTPSLLSGLMGEAVTELNAKTIRSYYVSFLSHGKGGMFAKNSFYYNFTSSDLLTAEKALLSLKNLVQAGGGQVISKKGSKLDFSSVHIFGSLPYGSDIYLPNSTLLKKDNRICILDASILPFAPEINPQALVMVLSKLVMERALKDGF